MKKYILLMTSITMLLANVSFGFGIKIDEKRQKKSDETLKLYKNPIKKLASLLPELGTPVHEEITRKAIDNADLDEDNSYQILLGLLWNDDPDGHLFPKTFSNPKGYD